MIFHLALNSFLVFFILAVLIEAVLRLFKIQNARLRMLCRALPFLKLPFDMLFFAFVDENAFVNFNPFSCELYLHSFVMQFLPEHLRIPIGPNDHFVIPSYIASYLPEALIQAFVWSVSMMACVGLATRIVRFVKTERSLLQVIQQSESYREQIGNTKLRAALQQTKVRISSEIQTPFAAFPNTILLPKALLEQLSHEEVEAIIAHELEHLLWKDPLFKWVNGLISAFFWWIPTAWWSRRFAADQEQASDAAIFKYGISEDHLASALLTTVKQRKQDLFLEAAVCPFDSGHGIHLKRLQNLLEPQSRDKRIDQVLILLSSAALFLIFWAC